MPIPESEREVYALNPLDKVICQLRFPANLRLESNVPAEFQEAIKADYPILTEVAPRVEVSGPAPGLPVEAPLHAFQGSIGSPLRNYQFVSTDECWTVNLTRDWITLSSSRYEKWEDFKQRLSDVVGKFTALYAPPFCTRVGLRYLNVVRPSLVGMDGTSADFNWSLLLEPHITGALGRAEVKTEVVESRSVSVLQLGGNSGLVRVAHGLAQDSVSHEQCFLIDADFFIDGKVEIRDVDTKLDYFNRNAGNLFRWCITPELHGRLKPTKSASAV